MVFSSFSERRLRLPLALGVAALMTTGSAAMAWPLFKEALVSAPRLAEARSEVSGDVAAVAAFVDMTRSIAGSAIAPEGETPVAGGEIRLADARSAPADNTVSDAVADNTAAEPGAEPGGDPGTVVVPRPRPAVAAAPRPPVPAPRATPVLATPVAAPLRGQSDAELRAAIRHRLLNRWSAGEFR